MDRAFLIVLSRVIGLRFFGGPFGLPGFCRAINSPELILRDSCSSKTLFKTFAMLPCNVGVPYLRSSPLISSSPGALLFLRLSRLFRTSSGVIGLFSFLGGP